jgi:hypothetical protein
VPANTTSAQGRSDLKEASRPVTGLARAKPEHWPRPYPPRVA